MKFSAPALLVLAAGTLTSAKPGGAPMPGPDGEPINFTAVCEHTQLPPLIPVPMMRSFLITAVVDEDIGSICHRLWHNLERFQICKTITSESCADGGLSYLNWAFTVGPGCNPGMVNSAWWETTRGRYGNVYC
ncbi:hypothetical protein EsH8_II_001100 [Colletotrichum jinshuiense]